MRDRGPRRPVGRATGAGRLRRLCGLQEYFDDLEIKATPPPRIVSAWTSRGEAEVSRSTAAGAIRLRERVSAHEPSQGAEQNWQPVPRADRQGDRVIEVEVRWSEKAGHQARADRRVSGARVGQAELGAALPALPLRAPLRRAALSPAAGDLGPAASGAAPRRGSGCELPPISTVRWSVGRGRGRADAARHWPRPGQAPSECSSSGPANR